MTTNTTPTTNDGLPPWLWRAVTRAVQEAQPGSHTCIGYIGITSLAWVATIDDRGVVVGEACRVLTEPEWHAWRDTVKRHAAETGERLVVFDLAQFGIDADASVH